MKTLFLVCSAVAAMTVCAAFRPECIKQHSSGPRVCAGKRTWQTRGTISFCCEDNNLDAALRRSDYRIGYDCDCMPMDEMCNLYPAACSHPRVITSELNESEPPPAPPSRSDRPSRKGRKLGRRPRPRPVRH